MCPVVFRVWIAIHEAEIYVTKECVRVARLTGRTIRIRPTEISAEVIATTAWTTTVGVEDIAGGAVSLVRWVAFTSGPVTVLTWLTVQIGVPTAVRFALVGITSLTSHTVRIGLTAILTLVDGIAKLVDVAIG